MRQAMFRTSDTVTPAWSVGQFLIDRFRCPEDVAGFTVSGDLSGDSGYFRLGSDIICYGQCSSGVPAARATDPLHDALEYVVMNGATVDLPFNPAQIVDNLRSERYQATWAGVKTLPASSMFRALYYLVRPMLPVAARKHLQRLYFRGWEKIPFPMVPVDRTVERIFEKLLCLSMKSRKVDRVPFIWFWPDGAPSCTMITHDVETSSGRDFCSQLMDLNDSFGIKSSFQIVPERRYRVSQLVLDNIRKRGFEINVHDLNHDGRLLCSREEFLSRAKRINLYGRQFGALGFRSAVMYRNIDWYDALDFSYDMSIPNMAHLDPQQGGCCTVLPFFIGNIVELPLTTTQDYSLFNILNDYSIRLWKEQIVLIRQQHGLISFIVHPDYIIHQSARRVYTELLCCLHELRSKGETWIALPSEIAAWWRLRSELKLVKAGGAWRIEGTGSERARLAYAVMVDDRISYKLAPPSGADSDSCFPPWGSGKDVGGTQSVGF